jgi:signal transduction histidine kinase
MWEKVVLNLLSNAFKFTFDGSICVRLENKDDHVELAVSDSGTGIPEEELPRLFERFYTLKARGGGLLKAPASGWRWCRNW